MIPTPSSPVRPAAFDPSLDEALRTRDANALRALVRAGADLNHACVRYQGDWLATPLRQACRDDDVAMVEVLLDLGADPHRCARIPVQPMHDRAFALSWGHSRLGFLETSNATIAQRLWERGWPCTVDDRERSLLLGAHHHLATVVRQRLAEGTDVHVRLDDPVMLFPGAKASLGNTALHLAIGMPGDPEHGTPGDLLECVQALVDAGADVHALNHESRTPLTQAFVASGLGDDPAWMTAQAEAMRALLHAGADPYRVEDEGSVLMRALGHARYAPLIPHLLDARARVEAPAPSALMASMGALPLNAGSALVDALRSGTLDQVTVCLDLGASPNALAQTMLGSPTQLTPLTALVLRRPVRPVLSGDQDHQEQGVLLDRLLAAGLDLATAVRTPSWDALVNERLSNDATRALRQQRVQRIAQMAEDFELRRTLDGMPEGYDRGRPRL